VNVGIFQDSNCTQQLVSIGWGTLDNGTSAVHTVYVTNDGTSNMTLSLSNSTWVPSDAPDYLTLTWNRETYVLERGTSVDANLTLSVSPSFTNGTDFSVDIIITGTQQTQHELFVDSSSIFFSTIARHAECLASAFTLLGAY
jgi:hypothetical protein